MKRQRFFRTAALILAAGLLTGCGNSGSVSTDTRDMIGMIAYSLDDQYTDSIIGAFFQNYQAPDTEYQHQMMVEMHDAKSSEETEEENLERYISLQYQILMVDPVDCYSTVNLLRYAKENDTPILFFDRKPREGTLDLWGKSFYVGVDEEEIAKEQAAIISNRYRESGNGLDINGDGRISAFFIVNSAGHTGREFQELQVIGLLQDAGIGVTVENVLNSDGDQTETKEKLRKLLSDESSVSPELILTDSDTAALGAADALKEAGITTIPIVGQGGTEAGRKGVDDGILAGTVGPDFTVYAKALLESARVAAEGKDLSLVEGAADKQTVLVPVSAYESSG